MKKTNNHLHNHNRHNRNHYGHHKNQNTHQDMLQRVSDLHIWLLLLIDNKDCLHSQHILFPVYIHCLLLSFRLLSFKSTGSLAKAMSPAPSRDGRHSELVFPNGPILFPPWCSHSVGRHAFAYHS